MGFTLMLTFSARFFLLYGLLLHLKIIFFILALHNGIPTSSKGSFLFIASSPYLKSLMVIALGNCCLMTSYYKKIDCCWMVCCYPEMCSPDVMIH
jgi:hypothetical protein